MLCLAIASLSLIISSCSKDFLEKEPSDKLTPITFFRSENDLKLYTNSFYARQLPTALGIVQADEMGDYSSKTNSPLYISGTYTPVNEPAWNWTDLRNINYFLKYFNNPSIPENVRKHYEGVAKFFRAYFYFDKVKTYGDVPWYSSPLDVDDKDELFKGRDPRTLVMDSVLADLSFACEHINDVKDNTASTITRQVALALKSRICLFEGTFRKYHTQLNLVSSADRWLREAADASLKVIQSGKYSLYNTGNPSKDYRYIFTQENPVSQEIMWSVVHNNALRKWHDITWKFTSATYGARWGLIRQFVNTYLSVDGTRFTDKPDYDKMTFIEEMTGRDARLAQTIRSLGYKRSDGTAAPANFAYTFTGYHLYKFSLDDKSLDAKAESYNSVPVFRYAEVLLNYAEAMAELNQFTQEVWTETIAKIRARAGLPQTIPATADTYIQQTYFPGITDKFLLEIRRERGIELVYEGHRYNDLLRWKSGSLLEMQWRGIYVPQLDIPIDLDGNGTGDACFVKTLPAVKLPNVVYVVVDGVSTKLSENTKGYIIWRDNENRLFDEKKYFHPIATSDIVLNPALKQNPGW